MPSDPLIGLATSFTSDPVARLLGESGRQLSIADFNQIHTVCIDPTGTFGAEVDRLVVLWRLEDVFQPNLNAWRAGSVQAGADLEREAVELVQMIAAASRQHAIPVVMGLPPHPIGCGIDPLDPTESVPLARLVAVVREAAETAANQHVGLRIIDHGRLVDNFGTKAHDHRNQMLYRQPYASGFNRLLANEVGRVLDALDQAPPKAIVLDADNTLWGGVVGEDGVAGIQIGGNFPGVAFEQFQVALRSLRAKGILLAVASKNNPGAVEEVFEKRPEMVLGSDDIAAWRVGWGQKSASIREIAADFNIGLDSVVFVDDSPFEIAEVSAQLPEVRCLLVPEDIEELPDLIAETGWYRSMEPSTEDLERTNMIQVEGQRRQNAASLSHADFLASLDLHVTVQRDDSLTLQRITQLINKTNQFNLTTVRRTEVDVEALVASDQHSVYAFSVEDRFGSYGLVAVAIVEWETRAAVLDSFLMSCRVLKRGIETAVLSLIASDADKRGIEELVGRFDPTAKNMQVAELYPLHGFDTVDVGVFAHRSLSALVGPQHITIIDA